MVLTLGACADSPTQPDQQRAPDLAAHDVQAQGCVEDGGVCLLPPVSSDDPCDPYQQLDNSCDDDTCMMSAPAGGRPSEPGRPAEPGRPGGGLTTQGCTDGGGGTGGDGGGGGGGSGDGDGDGTTDDGICTADENGTVCESEDRPECERRPDALWECVTRPPNTTEWAELAQKVDRMTENTEYCRGAKAIAQEMYAAGREGGRIVLWDGRNYVPGTNKEQMVWGKNSSDTRGRIIEMDSYLASAVPSLLAHEALHAYLYSINWPGTLQEQEDWVRAREIECAG